MLDTQSLQGGFLVLARLTAFIYLLPFFSIKGTPSMVKIGFGVILTALLLPSIDKIDIPAGMVEYALLIIKEVLVGLVLGYVSLLTFSAIRIAGGLIDMQMGLSMATVFDVQTHSRITVIGQFLFLFQILLFLAVDGHHALLMAISYSYSLIPVVAGGVKIEVVPAVFQLFIQVFSLGVRIAVPFIVVFLICDIALGIVARTVPQLNIFILGFPVKIGIGLITLAAIMPFMAVVVNNIFGQMESDILMVMGLMR